MIIDSNILVYAFDQASTKYIRAQAFIENNSNNVFITQQNICETMRVLTHPKYPNHFTATEITKAFYLLQKSITTLSPHQETTSILFALIKKYSIVGNQIFDAYLVATALSNGIDTIATDNVKHLSKYKEIKVMNPFE